MCYEFFWEKCFLKFLGHKGPKTKFFRFLENFTLNDFFFFEWSYVLIVFFKDEWVILLSYANPFLPIVPLLSPWIHQKTKSSKFSKVNPRKTIEIKLAKVNSHEYFWLQGKLLIHSQKKSWFWFGIRWNILLTWRSVLNLTCFDFNFSRNYLPTCFAYTVTRVGMKECWWNVACAQR